MTKHWLLTTLCALALALPALAAPAPGQVVTLQHPSQIVNGHLMVPIRDLYESVGGTVQYDRSNGSITAIRATHVATMTIGSTTAYLDGQQVYLNPPPNEMAGTALVPVNFAAQAAGVQVAYTQPSGPATVYLGAPSTVLLGGAGASTPLPAANLYLAIAKLDPENWSKVHSLFDVEGTTAPFATVRVTLMGAIELSPSDNRTFLLRSQPRDFLTTARDDGAFSVQIDARQFAPGSHISLMVQAKDVNGLAGPARPLDLFIR